MDLFKIKFSVVKVILLLVTVTKSLSDVDVEKYLKTCDRSSVDVNDCLVDAVQEGMELMCDGIPDLGVPPIDPYHQDEIKVEYKNNQITAKMHMKDIYVTGLKKSKVRDVRLKADEDRFHMEIDMTSPKIIVNGQYSGEGRYNSLKIDSSGEFNTTMLKLVYTWKLDGVPEKRGNDVYMKIKTFYMRPDVDSMKVYASNIFPDNPELTELANTFANNNWRPIYRELLPYAQANWNKIGVKVANKVFQRVPYDKLFPARS